MAELCVRPQSCPPSTLPHLTPKAEVSPASLTPALPLPAPQVAVSTEYDTKTTLLTISVRYSGSAITAEELSLLHPSQYKRLVSGRRARGGPTSPRAACSPLSRDASAPAHHLTSVSLARPAAQFRRIWRARTARRSGPRTCKGWSGWC